ncbi:MAG TPA: adventurous gliding motility lipoprotein CglC [Myxococcales bacterium]|nr:adventurous gliding motility lipoprotein CglC [Myxococcales bacterium]
MLVIGASGCPGCSPGDVGAPCVLQKRNPDGGRPLFMTGSDVTAQGQDIVSLGAQGCDDFICVHDLGMQTPDAGEVLRGYCTHACSGTGTGPCGTSYEQEPGRPYECRALLLDDLTLRQLCFEQPGLCSGAIGVERSSNFCARGLTDGGG